MSDYCIALIVLFCGFLLAIPVSYGQGAKYQKSEIRQQDKDYYANRMRYQWKSGAQSQYSLRRYCHQPGNQGNSQSCTAWAATYGALSIEYAVQKNAWSDADSVAPFSPWYLVHFLTTAIGESCDSSIAQLDVLKQMKSNGVCLEKELGVTDHCNIRITEYHRQKAKQHRIADYRILFDIDYHESSSERIEIITKALSDNKPVIIGIDKVYHSFRYLYGEEIWTEQDKRQIPHSAHSMLVIGYDKEYFEIMNSWGTEWGNGGFARVPKEELVKWAFNAFILISGQEKASLQIGSFAKINTQANSFRQDSIPWVSSDLDGELQLRLPSESLFHFPIKTTWSTVTNRAPLMMSFLKTNDKPPVLVRASYLKQEIWYDIPGDNGTLFYAGKNDTLLVLISCQDHEALAPAILAFQKSPVSAKSLLQAMNTTFKDVAPVTWKTTSSNDFEKQAVLSYNWTQPSFNYFYIVLNNDD